MRGPSAAKAGSAANLFQWGATSARMVVLRAACAVSCAGCWALLCCEGIEPSTLPTARPECGGIPRRWDALARNPP